MGLPDGDTDPTLDDLSDTEYEFLEDPPELVEARNRLAAYTSRPGEEEPAGGTLGFGSGLGVQRGFKDGTAKGKGRTRQSDSRGILISYSMARNLSAPFLQGSRPTP